MAEEKPRVRRTVGRTYRTQLESLSGPEPKLRLPKRTELQPRGNDEANKIRERQLFKLATRKYRELYLLNKPTELSDLLRALRMTKDNSIDGSDLFYLNSIFGVIVSQAKRGIAKNKSKKK